LREEVLAWGRYALSAPQPPPIRGPSRLSLGRVSRSPIMRESSRFRALRQSQARFRDLWTAGGPTARRHPPKKRIKGVQSFPRLTPDAGKKKGVAGGVSQRNEVLHYMSVDCGAHKQVVAHHQHGAQTHAATVSRVGMGIGTASQLCIARGVEEQNRSNSVGHRKGPAGLKLRAW